MSGAHPWLEEGAEALRAAGMWVVRTLPGSVPSPPLPLPTPWNGRSVPDVGVTVIGGRHGARTPPQAPAPGIPLVIVCDAPTEAILRRSLHHGAGAVLWLGEFPVRDLPATVAAVAAGRTVLSPRAAHALGSLLRPSTAAPDAWRSRHLSPGESEVVEHVLGGLTNRQIASTLMISEKTVKNRLTAAYRKLALDGRRTLRGTPAPMPPARDGTQRGPDPGPRPDRQARPGPAAGHPGTSAQPRNPRPGPAQVCLDQGEHR